MRAQRNFIEIQQSGHVRKVCCTYPELSSLYRQVAVGDSLTWKTLKVKVTSLSPGRGYLKQTAKQYKFNQFNKLISFKGLFTSWSVLSHVLTIFYFQVNTALQITVIWMSVASPVFGFTDHILLKSLWCLSALTTIASGFSYVQRKDTVRILKESEKERDANWWNQIMQCLKSYILFVFCVCAFLCQSYLFTVSYWDVARAPLFLRFSVLRLKNIFFSNFKRLNVESWH